MNETLVPHYQRREEEEEMFHHNKTSREEYEASRYYFGLYASTPLMWQLERDVVLDIPDEFWLEYLKYLDILS